MQERRNDNFSNAIRVLAFSIGFIYFSFGILKFFHNYSPAEWVAMQTIHKLTFGFVADRYSLMGLAVCECIIGAGLLFRFWLRPVLIIMFVHLLFTFTPFIFFPAETFGSLPGSFTLLGQYIIKNIVLASGGYVMWQYFKKQPMEIQSKEKIITGVWQ